MTKMHADELHIDDDLVRHLIDTQFSKWSHLPIQAVKSGGTDNVIYRLGDTYSIRLPRIEGAVAQIDKESQWLPYLAPHLPVKIPNIVANGQPDEKYPLKWAIHEWIDGENATFDRILNPTNFAENLASFITTLQAFDNQSNPNHLSPYSSRSVSLQDRDTYTRQAIAECHNLIDTLLALEVWQDAFSIPEYDGELVFCHCDLQSGNILVRNGTLTAIIDFGMFALADPALDLMPAWNLFDVSTREHFRQVMVVDTATWLRGRAWALSVAVIALPYYQHTNPTLANISRYTIEQVFVDYKNK